MDGRSNTVEAQLRVQMTLVPAGRAGGSRSGAFRTQLRLGTRNFPCDVLPEVPVSPGGAAVHCGVAFVFPDDAPNFPPGTLFEVWENGRVGYGTVLASTRR
jgi:hypothetical protein